MSSSALPALLPDLEVLWHPCNHVQLHNEVWCGHLEGPVCHHGAVWWHGYVSRHWWPDIEGDHGHSSQQGKDQDHWYPGTQVLSMNWRLYPRLHLQVDVNQYDSWVWYQHWVLRFVADFWRCTQVNCSVGIYLVPCTCNHVLWSLWLIICCRKEILSLLDQHESLITWYVQSVN